MSTGTKANLPGRLIALWKQLTPPQRALVIGLTVVACWLMGPLAPFLLLVVWGQLKRRSQKPGASSLLKTVFSTLEPPAAPPPPRARTAKLRQPAPPAAAPRKAIAPPVVAEARTAVVPPAADPFEAFTTPLEPLTGFGSRPNGFDEALAMLRGEDEPKAGDRR